MSFDLQPRKEGESWTDYIQRRYAVSQEFANSVREAWNQERGGAITAYFATAALIGMGLVDLFIPEVDVPNEGYFILGGIALAGSLQKQEGAKRGLVLWIDEMWDRAVEKRRVE